MKRTSNRKLGAKPRRRMTEAEMDRRDVAASKKALRRLHREGGYVVYDARQIARW